MMFCGDCGFIFADCATDPSTPGLYEEDWARTEVHPTFIYSRGKYMIRNEQKLRALLDRLAPFRKTNRLLDVGCSAAFFLKLARDRKWDVQGVEVSEFGVKYSREQLGIPVFHGFLQDAHLSDGSLDAVFSSHVIEHVRNPVNLLKEMRRVLRPGGALATVLPTQFASPGHSLFGQWMGEGPPRHVSYFTKRVFEHSLRNLGFSIIYSRQNVELRNILSILHRQSYADGKNRIILHTAATQGSSSLFVRAVKVVLNLVATGLGVGDELTTIAVKTSTSIG